VSNVVLNAVLIFGVGPFPRLGIAVAAPLTGMRILQTSARFPFLFMLGVLGTPVVTAYAVGRRVMLLALMPAWEFSTAASTLVGQRIGAGDDDAASEYGWQTLRIALAMQLLVGAVIVVFARPIALAFGTEHVDATVAFIWVFGVVIGAFSLPIGGGWGLPAVFLALIADCYAKAAVNTGRFRSGAWKRVARESGVGAGADG